MKLPVLLLLLASPAYALDAGGNDLPLLPLGAVHRPAAADDTPAVPQRCTQAPPAGLKDRLPFGPGELLAYDIALLGIRTGKVFMKVGERTTMDGVTTFPLQAEAKSDSFLDVLGHFDARMVSFFDPVTLLPVRMVNHVVAHQPFVEQPVDSREDGAFGKGGVNAHYKRTAADGWTDKNASLTTSDDVVDILSVVYYLRAHELVEGAPFCFELYHRRRLWHIEGTVGVVEVVRPPLGAKRGRRLDATVTRVGGKDPPEPRPVTAWISDDADRFPLLVTTPDKVGAIDVRLLSFTRGRRLVAR